MLLLNYDQVCRLCDDPGGPVDAKAWSTLYMYRTLGRLD